MTSSWNKQLAHIHYDTFRSSICKNDMICKIERVQIRSYPYSNNQARIPMLIADTYRKQEV